MTEALPIDDFREPDFGTQINGMWSYPLVSELPQGITSHKEVYYQDSQLASQNAIWKLLRLSDGWYYVGGSPWITYNSGSQVMNEGTLSSAISTDRFSTWLERFTVPYSGTYRVSLQVSGYQDTSSTWEECTSVIADVDTEEVILEDIWSSSGSTNDTRNGVYPFDRVELEKGQELGLFAYRTAQIWSMRYFGWEISPTRLDIQ